MTMSKAKKRIPVGDGYEVIFDQRAEGQESPYWLGRVFRHGKQVGTFENSGRGGMTHIHPPAIVDAFRKLVDEADPVRGPTCFERESLVIVWAEVVGYVKDYLPGNRPVPLGHIVRQFAKDFGRPDGAGGAARATAVGTITKETFAAAPAWTMFRGAAADPGPIFWDLFDFNINDTDFEEDPAHDLEALRIKFTQPELDSEYQSEQPAGADDNDAALAYLRRGGTLCKVPDAPGSPYWRLLVVGERVSTHDFKIEARTRRGPICWHPYASHAAAHEDLPRIKKQARGVGVIRDSWQIVPIHESVTAAPSASSRATAPSEFRRLHPALDKPLSTDPRVMKKRLLTAGVGDPARFLVIEQREVVDEHGNVARRWIVTGVQHLDELRALLARDDDFICGLCDMSQPRAGSKRVTLPGNKESTTACAMCLKLHGREIAWDALLQAAESAKARLADFTSDDIRCAVCSNYLKLKDGEPVHVRRSLDADHDAEIPPTRE